ncbi:MAG: hypothetical protein LBG92_05880 [Prevotellaceae bacterium]|jgi:hypothetical protein|nr:hypothetical protein [Prevotellaceae bacterium]
MKRKFLKFAAIALLLTGTVIACDKKNDSNESSLSNVAYYLCNNTAGDRENSAPLQEYIKYSSINDYILRFE